MSEIDRLIVMRIRAMFFAALAFGLWQFSWLASRILESTPGTGLLIAQICTLVGALSWAGASIFYGRFASQVKKASACAPLNDELTCHNRAQAFGIGFMTILLGVVLLIGLAEITSWNIVYGLKVVAIIGVIVPILVFTGREYNDHQRAE